MILHIIQARIGSSRLPGKINMHIGGKSLLRWHMENTSDKSIKQIVPIINKDLPEMLAKSDCDTDKFKSVHTPEDDVLSRFYTVAKHYSPEWIVRTTADCPFIDREWFLKTVKIAVENDMPIFNTFKEGSCTEVFKFEHLQRAFYEATDPKDREHVTSYFRKGFEKGSIDSWHEFYKAKELYESK